MNSQFLAVLLAAMLAGSGFAVAQNAPVPEVRRVVTGLDVDGFARALI